MAAVPRRGCFHAWVVLLLIGLCAAIGLACAALVVSVQAKSELHTQQNQHKSDMEKLVFQVEDAQSGNKMTSLMSRNDLLNGISNSSFRDLKSDLQHLV